jgi:hypothetical protein
VLTYKHETCAYWKPISTGTNHQEFRDSHGNTILLNQLLTLPTTNESSYTAGYEHGVSDAKRGHITEDAASHTQKYDQGWVDGYCSIAGKGAGSDSDKGTFECSLDATEYNNSTHHHSLGL